MAIFDADVGLNGHGCCALGRGCGFRSGLKQELPVVVRAPGVETNAQRRLLLFDEPMHRPERKSLDLRGNPAQDRKMTIYCQSVGRVLCKRCFIPKPGTI